MTMDPGELKTSLNGLLAFALTPFDVDGQVDIEALRCHVELLLNAGCSAIFAAGGTGEHFSLTMSECHAVVSACSDQVAGRVPVLVGAGSGTVAAQNWVRMGESAGADGILILPPYLIDGPQEGLAQHYLAVAEATRLGVVIYQRGSTLFEPSTVQQIAAAPNVIGFKDGVGQIERLLRIRRALGSRLVYINGMPTAEISAPAFAACGVDTYSSAILTFIPEIALAFYSALRASNTAAMEALLFDAILPFAEIRNRVPGYAISLVKLGARLRGLSVGSVRPPLLDPSRSDETDLLALLRSLNLDSPLTCVRPAAV